MAEQSINKADGQGGEPSVYSKLKRQISGNKIKSRISKLNGCGLVYTSIYTNKICKA